MEGLTRKTILLVEDEAVIALAGASNLKGLGYHVITASSGEKAIDAARENPGIDLVLMDIDLGRGMDGTEAARAILGERDLPVVFLSSHTEPEIVSRTESVTSYGYVVKNSGLTVLDSSIKMAFKLFKAHANLKLSEMKYQSVVQSQREMICRFLPDTTLVFVNESYCRTFGGTPEQLIGRKFLDFIPPGDREEVMRHLAGLIVGGQVTEYEHRVNLPDGSTGWQSWTDYPIIDGSGSVRELQSVGRDITREKEAQERLRFQAQILDQIRDWITVTDLQGKIIYVNDAQCRILGFPREKLVGQHISVFGDDPGAGATQEEILNRTLEDGYWSGEVVNYRANGTRILLESRTNVVRDDRGAPIALCGVSTNITGRGSEQARIEETYRALRASEERLRIVIEASLNAIIAADEHGRIVLFNGAAERLFMYSVEEVLNMPVKMLLREEMGESHQESFLGYMQKGAAQCGHIGRRSEYPFRRSDGSEFYAEVAMAGGRGQGQRLVVVALHDVTERRSAEAAVRRNMEIFLKVFMSSPMVMTISSVDQGRFIEVNDSFLAAFGYRREEVIGKTSAELNLYADYANRDALMSRLVRSGSLRNADIDFMTKTGEVRNGMVSAEFIDLSGTSYLLIAMNDVTERRHAEDALRASEEKYRRLFDSMNDAFISVDMEGRIREYNRTIREMLGYSGEELGRMTYVDLTPERWHREERAIVEEQILKNGYSEIYEKEYRRKDGTVFPVELRAFLLRDRSGKPEGMWSIVRDISRRKRYERELESAASEKGVLLGEIQHRVKNSFAMVASLIHLESDRVNSQEARSTLMDLHARVKSLSDLYAMLFRSGDSARVLLDEYCGQVIDSLGQMFLAGAKKVMVEKKLDRVQCDVKSATSVGLILNELLTNAFKYAFPAGKTGSVEVRLEARGDRFVLTVSDDGIGPPPDFDPERSAGFGFTIIRLLSRQLDASLCFERNSRTVFWLSVPVIKA